MRSALQSTPDSTYRVARPTTSVAVSQQNGIGFEVTGQNLIRAGDVIYSATEIAAGVLLLGITEPTMITKVTGAILISKGSQSLVLNFSALVAGLSGSEKNASSLDFVEDVISFTGQGTVLAHATAQFVYGKPLPFSLSAALDITEALGQGAWGFAKLNMQIPEAQAPTLPPQPGITRPPTSPSNGRGSGANRHLSPIVISFDFSLPKRSQPDRPRPEPWPERPTQDHAPPKRQIERPRPPDRNQERPPKDKRPTNTLNRLP